jgi:hypothetical protein
MTLPFDVASTINFLFLLWPYTFSERGTRYDQSCLIITPRFAFARIMVEPLSP